MAEEESKFDKLKDKVKHEWEVLTGDEGRDKLYMAEKSFDSEQEANRAFQEAKERLFAVNRWTDISALSSTFTLTDRSGQPLVKEIPNEGDFIKIELPATKIENWVEVKQVRTGQGFAEFMVRPSQDPTTPEKEIKHFFDKNASSTFRVEIEGKTIRAYEIGLNEKINNQGKEAGDRAALNTVISESGWAFFQVAQWESLTHYLVGKDYPLSS